MRLRTRMILVLALLALLTGSLAQAAAAPATTTAAAQPATARAVADLSTPKASAVSLFAAIGAQDAGAVKQLLDTDDSAGELKDALAELLIASGRMSSASSKLFGRTGDPIGRPMLTVNDPTKVEEAQVVQDGDQATLQIVGHRRPMTFRRRDGKWRLMPDAINPADATTGAQQIKLLRNMSIAMNELAREIDSGKYQTSAEAERYVQEKLHAVMIETFKPARGPATTRASTQP